MTQQPQKAAPTWLTLREMLSAEIAEHARVGNYELTAFVIDADPVEGFKREIGWKVQAWNLNGWRAGMAAMLAVAVVASGKADSFEDAKTRAVAAWRDLERADGDS
jgi:hypothetical protein